MDKSTSSGLIIDFGVKQNYLDFKTIDAHKGGKRTPESNKFKQGESTMVVVSTQSNPADPKTFDYLIKVHRLVPGRASDQCEFIHGEISGRDKDKVKKLKHLLGHLTVNGSKLPDRIDTATSKQTKEEIFIY